MSLQQSAINYQKQYLFSSLITSLLLNHKNLVALCINDGVLEKARIISREKRIKAPLISYVTRKQKSLKNLNLLDHSGTYYVINDYDVRKSISVANLNAKRNKAFFFDQHLCEQNNTAEQSDNLQQLYIYINHSHKANFPIRDIGLNSKAIKKSMLLLSSQLSQINIGTKGKSEIIEFYDSTKRELDTFD